MSVVSFAVFWLFAVLGLGTTCIAGALWFRLERRIGIEDTMWGFAGWMMWAFGVAIPAGFVVGSLGAWLAFGVIS